jgi:hypothetical protein
MPVEGIFPQAYRGMAADANDIAAALGRGIYMRRINEGK